MPMQLNGRDGGQDQERKFGATAYDLPLNPPSTKTLSPVVAVLGHPGRIAGLAAHLPAGWSLRPVRDPDDVRPGELVLFTQATERDVRVARAQLPRPAPIVALVDERAPAGLVATLLTAGADACVRGSQPAILAGHLIACRRRQLADRWTELEAAARTAGR